MRATSALRAQCARDLGSGCAHCEPNSVLIQCTVCSHCFDTVHGHYSRTLFIGLKKKEYKNFKNFLRGDLIYEIFILHLL